MNKLSAFILGAVLDVGALSAAGYAVHAHAAPSYSATHITSVCADTSHADWHRLCGRAYAQGRGSMNAALVAARKQGFRDGRKGMVKPWSKQKINALIDTAIHSAAAKKLWEEPAPVGVHSLYPPNPTDAQCREWLTQIQRTGIEFGSDEDYQRDFAQGEFSSGCSDGTVPDEELLPPTWEQTAESAETEQTVPEPSDATSDSGSTYDSGYEGNGGGPTPCNDGSVSGSSGSGTCSGHGGILD